MKAKEFLGLLPPVYRLSEVGFQELGILLQ